MISNSYPKTSPPKNPKQIRQLLRAKRTTLTAEQQNQHATDAFHHLKKWLASFGEQNPKKTLKIALFLAQDGELNTAPVIDYLWQNEMYEVYLPRLHKDSKGVMSFVPYKPNSKMLANKFGILEPVADKEQELSGESIDIVIMPLVGFDKVGNRMGMGGGYYDRSFAHKLLDPTKKPILIGWAHKCQEFEKLPKEPWDVAMDGLITEKKMTSFKSEMNNESSWQA